MRNPFSFVATRGRRVSAATNAVRNALSQKRAEFRSEIHRIEGEANRQGGGVARLSSGLFVVRFADEIKLEFQKRSQSARESLRDALKLQERHVSQATATELKSTIRKVLEDETSDLRDWYQHRVQSVNPEIATDKPLHLMLDDALRDVFDELDNRVLAPGFWWRNLDRILAAMIGTIIGILITRAGQYLISLFR